MSKIYEIVDQNEYMIQIRGVESIEDCGDEFVSKEEAEELGLRTWSEVPQLFTSKVTDKLNWYISQIKEGQKSIIIDDVVLIETLTKTDSAVSEFVPDTRRVGNRLFKHEPKKKTKTKVTYSDWSKLMYLFELAMTKSKLDVAIRRTTTKRQPAVTLFKKMFTWEELISISEIEPTSNYWSDDLEWLEKLYNDPTLVDEVAE